MGNADTLGAHLKALRKDRRLTAGQLAQRANVSVRTIYYWEANIRSPWDIELNAVLDALDATPIERSLAIQMLRTPRGIRLAREPATRRDEDIEVPELGDVLWAMRHRSGWSQGRLSEALGVQRSTVRRWEASQMFPGEDNWQRICDVLQIRGADRFARQTLLSQPTEPWSGQLDELERQVQGWIDRVWKLDVGWGQISELSGIILERRLAQSARIWKEAIPLLVRMRVERARWLLFSGRHEEARKSIQLPLSILGQKAEGQLRPVIVTLDSLLSVYRQSGKTDWQAGFDGVQAGLDTVDARSQGTLLCDLAFYAGKLRDFETANSILDQVETHLSRLTPEAEMHRHYRMTRARVAVERGDGHEALELLPPLSGTGFTRLPGIIIRAEAYAAASEWNEAEKSTEEAFEIYTQSIGDLPSASKSQLARRILEVQKKL